MGYCRVCTEWKEPLEPWDLEDIRREERERLVKLLTERKEAYIRGDPGALNGNASGAVFYSDAIRIIGGASE